MYDVTVMFTPSTKSSPLKLNNWELVEKKLNNEDLSKETLKRFVVLEPIRDISDKVKLFNKITVNTLSGSTLHYFTTFPKLYFESSFDYDQNFFNIGNYAIPIDQIFLIKLTSDNNTCAMLINKNTVDYIERT